LLGDTFVLLGVTAAAAPSPIAFPQIVQGISPQNRVTLIRNTRRHLTSGRDTGASADTKNLDDMLLQLQRSPERERALQDMIEAMHNPQSPSFHHWLSNDDLFTGYGPYRYRRGDRKCQYHQYRRCHNIPRCIRCRQRGGLLRHVRRGASGRRHSVPRSGRDRK